MNPNEGRRAGKGGGGGEGEEADFEWELIICQSDMESFGPQLTTGVKQLQQWRLYSETTNILRYLIYIYLHLYSLISPIASLNFPEHSHTQKHLMP